MERSITSTRRHRGSLVRSAGVGPDGRADPSVACQDARILDHTARQSSPHPIIVDRYRAIVFPNRMREMRVRHSQSALLPFAATLSDIPYIRLSKIERGEVYPRVDELVRIAARLGIAPRMLLIDVDAPTFEMAAWFAPFADGSALDDDAEAGFALLLAAAVRARRAANPALTAAVLDARYAIPPVILSRLENAQKGLARWNAQTVAALCAFFDLPDAAALRATITRDHAAGRLDPFLAAIPGEAQRLARTRQRIAALDRELQQVDASAATPVQGKGISTSPAIPVSAATNRTLPVYGVPMGGGRIAKTPAGRSIEAPAIAGPNAFGLRLGPATLGGGLPGQSTVIVDPDRYPQAGGLALVRDGEGYRVLSVAVDRGGVLQGYSLNPEYEVALDTLPPGDVCAIVAAQFV